MCEPASMVVTKTKVYWSKNTESHHEIIKEFNLKEQNVRGEYILVPIEIIPPHKDFRLPLSKWKFKIDYNDYYRDLPKWWDTIKAEKQVRLELKKWLKAKILMPKKSVELIETGQKVAIYGEVKCVRGSATIDRVEGKATIDCVEGSATIKYVLGSATIDRVGGKATIKYVEGSATIKYVEGKATIIS